MSKKEKFNVGDEVFDVTTPETRAVVTRCKGNVLYVIFCDGSCGEEDINLFKRTGRKFNLQVLLDELL